MGTVGVSAENEVVVSNGTVYPHRVRQPIRQDVVPLHPFFGDDRLGHGTRSRGVAARSGLHERNEEIAPRHVLLRGPWAVPRAVTSRVGTDSAEQPSLPRDASISRNQRSGAMASLSVRRLDGEVVRRLKIR